jgi:cytochrome P450
MTETTDPARADGLARTYSPFESPQLENPFPIWERARSERPFFSEALQAWVVTRYDDVAWVLRDYAAFSSVGGSKGIAVPPPEVRAVLEQVPDPQQMDVLTSDPPRHSRLRRFMQNAFSAKRVASMEEGLRALAHELVDGFEAHGSCDFYESFAFPYPLSAIGQLLDMPRQDQSRVKFWVTCNIQLKWGNLEPTAHLEAARGRVDFYHYARTLIDARRASPGEDLISALVADSDQSDDPLSEPEMVGQIMTFLTAGHETTANWLALGVYRLLEDHSRWEVLCSDPRAVNGVVEETLRYDGSAQALWRTAVKDVEVSGTVIPKDARVAAVVGAADRDSNAFDAADTFDLHRPNVTKHLQFGRGIHSCVGAGLARLEGHVAFEVLAARLPTLRLLDGGQMVFQPSAIQRVPRRLMVAWDRT